MKLYVIRHGESETNKKGCWTGWLDAPLTDKGISDAERARSVIGNVGFDKIYSSDLIRAKKTAEIAVPGREYETTPLLREIALGSLEGKPLSCLDDALREKTANACYSVIGGEDYSDLAARARTFIKQIETLDCENVAAFSHAGWLCAALDLVVGVRLPRKNIRCSNCTVAIFEYGKGIWRLHSWINLS